MRVDGSIKRIKIGTYPTVGLSDARDQAKSILHDAQLGIEPPEVSQTLGEVVPMFITLYAKPRNRGWREQERLLDQKWSPLYNTPISQIKRTDAVRILDKIVAGGAPGRANNALAVIKKLMNWALDRGMIDVNPIAGLKPPSKPKARDRVLTDVELSKFMEAASEEAYPFGLILQVLLLTGQRRGEVSKMKWSHIDFDTATWSIPARS